MLRASKRLVSKHHSVFRPRRGRSVVLRLSIIIFSLHCFWVDLHQSAIFFPHVLKNPLILTNQRSSFHIKASLLVDKSWEWKNEDDHIPSNKNHPIDNHKLRYVEATAKAKAKSMFDSKFDSNNNINIDSKININSKINNDNIEWHQIQTPTT